MAKERRRTTSADISDNPTRIPDRPDGSGDDRDRVATRAYELYLARGGGDGGDFDDWLAAEREIASGTTRTRTEDAGE